MYLNQKIKIKPFQSTLLVRGATRVNKVRTTDKGFQSTLLVRGATYKSALLEFDPFISIHAPRERSDSQEIIFPRLNLLFQSTLLVRGATLQECLYKEE